MINKKFSRRHFLSLAGLSVAGLALSGCNSGKKAKVQGGSRKVKDLDGNEIEVPASPQKVVAMSEPTLDNALALGVPLVGATAGRGQSTIPNYLSDKGKDIPILGNVAQPNFEAIGAAKPDLILVDGTSVNNNQPVLDALAKIAPTVYTGYPGGDWRENLRLTADALNMVEEAEDLMKDYDKKVKEAAKKLEKYQDKTFSIIRWQGNNAALILKELPAGRALTDLGLQRPPAQDMEGKGHSEPVSQENLSDIDADYIFFGTLGGSSVGNTQAGGSADTEGAKEAIAEATKVPGFEDLYAYQEDHIIPVDGSLWTSTGGVLLMNAIVDQVVEFLV